VARVCAWVRVGGEWVYEPSVVVALAFVGASSSSTAAVCTLRTRCFCSLAPSPVLLYCRVASRVLLLVSVSLGLGGSRSCSDARTELHRYLLRHLLCHR